MSMNSSNRDGGPVVCPFCASPRVMPVRRNYDAGMGCLGLVLFGWIGLLFGLLGGGDVELFCADCGSRWSPEHRSGLGCPGCLFGIILLLCAWGFYYAFFLKPQ